MPRGESYRGSEKEIIKKLPSEGKEWVERREESRADSIDEDYHGIYSSQEIFGYQALTNWEFLNGRGKRWERMERPEVPNIVRQREKQRAQELFVIGLEKVNNQLKVLAYKRQSVLRNFVKEYITDQDLAELSKKLGIDKGEYHISDAILKVMVADKLHLSAEDKEVLRRRTENDRFVFAVLTNIIFGKKIPSDVLLPMLENHRQKVLTAEKEMLSEVREFKERIREQLDNAIDEGKIPISKELVDERISSLQFKVVDPMAAKLAEIWGDYSASSHLIRISAEVPKKHRWTVFVHEVFHALSGQIEYKSSPVLYQNDPALALHNIIKVGAHFMDKTKIMRSKEIVHGQLNWLNEALTEEATVDLTGEERYVYKDQRELLKMLIAAGVPKVLLMGAYFENYIPKTQGEHRLPKTRQLFDAVNEIFGSGFLFSLDRYINFVNKQETTKKKPRSGVKVVVEKWQIHGTEFPKFVNEWSHKEAIKYRQKHQKQLKKRPSKRKS